MVAADTKLNIYEIFDNWVKERPAWQIHALQRLEKTESLTQDDIQKLINICMKQEEVDEFTDLNFTKQREAQNSNIRLKSISNVENVNALSSGQKLSFCKKGVTIVYGDNGTGKSGYIRILKNACRSRASEDIIGNIYRDHPPYLPQANIEYLQGKQALSYSLEEAQRVIGTIFNPSDELETKDTNYSLSPISIFDSRTANINVDKQNDIIYEPYPLGHLNKLAELCDHVKDALTKKQDALKRETPQSLRKLNI